MARNQKDSVKAKGAALARSLIETGASSDDFVSVYIIFPASGAMLTPLGSGLLESTALVQIRDGTIWMLRALCVALTAEKLSVAARAIMAARRADFDGKEFERYLKRDSAFPCSLG